MQGISLIESIRCVGAQCEPGCNVCAGVQCERRGAVCASWCNVCGMPALRHEVTVYVTALVRQAHVTQAAIVPDDVTLAHWNSLGISLPC